MSDIAIRVVGLGKKYRIGALQQRRTNLREELTYGLRQAARALASPMSYARALRAARDEVWALQDVGFEVQRGETIGIIGGNGAGKSTLLKILSRITKPSVGEAWIHGRVASLLEVGTGFHPELTGRENAYLNGAILGMRRGEVARKFDEIVAFAGVERFIDTPVKRYSSGMYLRLAFAVAAHLEPEILIVDEVLAVGDAAFQQKCLGKMNDVAQSGRTVLFVSHNMDAVQRLCSRCVFLKGGRLAAIGPTEAVIGAYLDQELADPGPEGWVDISHLPRQGTGEARFLAVQYSGDPLRGGSPYSCGPLEFLLEIESGADQTVPSLSVSLRNRRGVPLLNADVAALGQAVRLRKGRNTIRFRLDAVYLNPGEYVVGLWMGEVHGIGFDHLEAAFQLQMRDPIRRGAGLTPIANGVVPCSFEVSVAREEPELVVGR